MMAFYIPKVTGHRYNLSVEHILQPNQHLTFEANTDIQTLCLTNLTFGVQNFKTIWLIL